MNTVLPKHWTFRPDTYDVGIFHEVAVANAYGLPERFEATDVIIDVGAHIGSFAYACIRRGAGRVICCEADERNLDALVHNVGPWFRLEGTPRVECVVCKPIWHREATMRFEPSSDNANTGGGGFVEDEHGSIIASPLANLLGGYRPVRMLKLDIEGAEHEIIQNTCLIDVNEIVGEMHYRSADAMDKTRTLLRSQFRHYTEQRTGIDTWNFRGVR